MKFKEIKPGMVIHCPTQENADELLKYLDELGYKWLSGRSLLKKTYYNEWVEKTCYLLEIGFRVTYGNVDEYAEYIEFSDLIEPELTAEEALEWIGEHYFDDEYTAIFGDYDISDIIKTYGKEEFKSRIAKWKADHEPKEPEVELQEAAKPLVEYLRKNYHPHATAIVSLDYAEILEGKEAAKYGEEV